MDKVMETRSQLPKLLKRVANGERFIITKRSKAKAVLVSLEEVETLEVIADKKLLRELIEAKADIKAGRYRLFDH
jgi:prevent-host-death family protein